MTTIRIICTHDALEQAKKLERILGAEGDDARVAYGRQSADLLPAACEAREAVLLIWSHEAPGASYMRAWADTIPPERLAEIAFAPGWPRTKRRAHVIDFAGWRGERAGRAWHALVERLRAIEKIVDPRPEPLRTPALMVGGAGALAAGVALMISGQAPSDPKYVAFDSDKIQLALIDGDAVGGPMDALEPASIGEDFGGNLRVRAISTAPLTYAAPPLAQVVEYEPMSIRDATLMERLSALNPIRRDEN